MLVVITVFEKSLLDFIAPVQSFHASIYIIKLGTNFVFYAAFELLKNTFWILLVLIQNKIFIQQQDKYYLIIF